MEIYLDEEVITANTAESTLAEVVAQAREHAAGDDRVIVSIVCDGQDISGEGLEARLAEPADKSSRIDMQSGRPMELVEEALTQAAAELEETDQLREQLADWLTQGESRQATQGLADCFQSWSRIHRAIAESIALLGLDIDSLEVNGEPISSQLTEITGQLRQIKKVLEAGDQVLLADLLRYEFEQATIRWKGALEAILARARSQSTA